MPRYRILKPLPDVLEYRGGVRLLLHQFDGMYNGQTLAYRKEVARSYDAVILCQSKLGTPSLTELLTQGFTIDSTHPRANAAIAIMDSLVLRGYAERLPG